MTQRKNSIKGSECKGYNLFGARRKADMKKTHKSGRSSRGCMALKFLAQTKRTKTIACFKNDMLNQV